MALSLPAARRLSRFIFGRAVSLEAPAEPRAEEAAPVRPVPPDPLAAAVEADVRSSRVQLARTESVDIIVCVHNALTDVKACFQSILACTLPPFRIIIVDDGSGLETRDYLRAFARAHSCVLHRNEAALGYTFAANQGMILASANWICLLNSDTIVSRHWLDELWNVGVSDHDIGIVGPLSNTASWQSAPAISDGGDWPPNDLPSGLDVASVGPLLQQHIAWPKHQLPFINGFCMLVRAQMLRDIGLFDEDHFAAGYGEENDLCIRAIQGGWRLVVCARSYVFHSQSKSYSHERRIELAARADSQLASKYDRDAIILPRVAECMSHLGMASVRASFRSMLERRSICESAGREFEGKRILFILPAGGEGGGAKVVLAEAKAMQRLGADAFILNFEAFRGTFEAMNSDIGVPCIYPNNPNDVPRMLDDPTTRYDAVVCTLFESVFWLPSDLGATKVMYYVQDYEPLFFPDGSPSQRRALLSYSHRADCILLSKSGWNADVLKTVTDRPVNVIGPSVDLDRFQARGKSHGPVGLAAMLRPTTPRRAAARTLRCLRQISERFGAKIELHLFGCDRSELNQISQGAGDFVSSTKFYGVVGSDAVASILSRCHIFVDLSDYQAMGLTALEAMASGCAVVVPARGGAVEFALDDVNALVVETSNEPACVEAIARLIESPDLRLRLATRAIQDAHKYPPELAARKILSLV